LLSLTDPFSLWRAREDSNLRPSAPEASTPKAPHGRLTIRNYSDSISESEKNSQKTFADLAEKIQSFALVCIQLCSAYVPQNLDLQKSIEPEEVTDDHLT
jgi:hypothetical protein